MADYVVTIDGVMETANGKSRVSKGQTVSLTDWEYAHNSHLFAPEPVILVAAPDPGIEYEIQPEPLKASRRLTRPNKSPAARASIKRR